MGKTDVTMSQRSAKKTVLIVSNKGDQEIISTLARSLGLSLVAVRARGSQGASLCRRRGWSKDRLLNQESTALIHRAASKLLL